MTETSTTSPVSDTVVTLVTQTRVLSGREADFAHWLKQLNETMVNVAGYLDCTVVPPTPPVQVDWVISQHFASADAARAWLQSDERLRLLDAAQPMLTGPDDVHLFTDSAGPKLSAPVTSIISMRVKPGQDEEFLQWQRRIAAVEARFEGFSGYRLEPPKPGISDDWVTVLRFDSDAQLDAWLNSPQRQALLTETPTFSDEFHVRKVRTGFDSWFAPAVAPGASSPPVWKQNMLVLLALYPTVFLFGFFVQAPFFLQNGVPFWLSLFIANATSTALLGWWFVPQLSRWFTWWLSPDETAPSWVPWAGVGLIVLFYGLCLLVFSRFP